MRTPESSSAWMASRDRSSVFMYMFVQSSRVGNIWAMALSLMPALRIARMPSIELARASARRKDASRKRRRPCDESPAADEACPW